MEATQMRMRFFPSHTGKRDGSLRPSGILLVRKFSSCNLQVPRVQRRHDRPVRPPAPKSASGALQIAAATIGNALEWFDILVYGYFATTIAGVFFPNSNPVVSLLLTFGSFGLSYVARPLGAVVLGAYADRAGRKTALALSIRLMVIGTAVMALMPSYATIGLIAPIAIFSARLLQGFAVAGEFGSSTAFMIEHSARRKAFFSSWQFAGQQMAKLLAGAVRGWAHSHAQRASPAQPGAGACPLFSAYWWGRSACISGAKWMRRRSSCRPRTPAPRFARPLRPRRQD